MSIDLNYKKKVIAFLDIMGFKNTINKTVDDTSFRENLIDCLIRLKGMENSRKSLVGVKFLEGKEVTAFSDSIVISYDLESEGSIFNILLDIIFMQIDLTAMGQILRGGVTIGDVFHGGGVVLGPAMNKAYEIESNLAIYPRIMVDPILLEYAYNNPSFGHSGEYEVKEISRLLLPCENSYYFTNFLGMSNELEYSYGIFMHDVKKIIDEGLKIPSIKIHNKYEWLEKYYNSVASKYKDIL
ncbi:MAG: hypothetical protein U0M06_07945 [Clostridia bacterium]|nr:hypothetical protein [Clostridia bacterium]